MKVAFFLLVSTLSIGLPTIGGIDDLSDKIILPDIKSPYNYADDFDEIIATPYKWNNTSTVRFKISFKKTTSTSIYTPIRSNAKDLAAFIYFYSGDELRVTNQIYQVMINADTYEYAGSFTYEAPSIYDSATLLFRVSELGSIKFTKRVKLKKQTTESSLSVTNAKTSKHSVEGLVYYYTHDNGEQYLTEEFDFSHFLSTGVGRFNYFDISKQYFTRSCLPNTIERTSISKAYMLMPNSEGRFSDIGEGNARIREIPLTNKYSLLGGKNYFVPAIDMYINPDTHEMSGTQKEGYVKTDKFFFSRMGLLSITVSSFVVYIRNAGYSLTNFRLSFRLVQTETSFNAYGNVAYSIGISSDDTNFNVGEVIEH